MEHTGESHGVPRETIDRLRAIARLIDRPIADQQIEALLRFERWLVEEAAPAGGIGPHEHDRIFDRHIADSLMYLKGLGETGTDAGARYPTEIVDVGSGVGLPGIPIAIVAPDIEVTLLDRSQRRTSLAQRVARILDLDNVVVVQGDVGGSGASYDAALFRASLPIPDAAQAFLGLTGPRGYGLVGVSRLHRRPKIPDPPEAVTFSLSAEGWDVLDSPFWLLRMRRNRTRHTGSDATHEL